MPSSELVRECVESVYDGDFVFDVPSPEATLESVEECRGLCRENLCGNYGTSWTCPPYIDSPEICIGRLDSYDRAIVIPKTFDADYKVKEDVERCTDEMQRISRVVAHALQERGVDAFPLADGPCRYCEKCTCTEGRQCRDPSNRVGSVSAYGIMVTEYMESVGLDVAPVGERLTLYSYILYR